MIFGLLYFCVVILCVNRSRSRFILYRIVKRHSRQSNVRRIWTCADNDRNIGNKFKLSRKSLVYAYGTLLLNADGYFEATIEGKFSIRCVIVILFALQYFF